MAKDPQVDPVRSLPGFALLSPEAQRVARELAAEPGSLELGDGESGISPADLEKAAVARATGRDALESRTIVQAALFVSAHRHALFPGLATPGDGPGSVAPVTPPASVDELVATLSVEEKARLLVMEYGDVGSVPGSGAIIVNKSHLNVSGSPLLALRAELYQRKHGFPLLVGADQEGGDINRLRLLPGHADTVFPSAAEMSTMSAEQIRAEGAKTGAALRDAGVNLLLGPVLDVADAGTLMAKMHRAFGETPEQVTARAGAFVAGLKGANPGVAVVAKHFPGYNVRGNSDVTPVTDPTPATELWRRAAPFFAVAGLDGFMLSSVRYTGLDGEPACFSPVVVGELRRHRPDALVMTDDLLAHSLYSPRVRAYLLYHQLRPRAQTLPGPRVQLEDLLRREPWLRDPAERQATETAHRQEVEENARRAFVAGVDLLLVMDNRKAAAVRRALVELIDGHPELGAQLDASVRRVLTMRGIQAAGHV
jgi:beta-glucosidase-like glycosyl hydrolase